MKSAPMPWRYVIALVVAGVLGGILVCGLAERALLLTQSPPNYETQHTQEGPVEQLSQLRDPMASLTLLIAVSTAGLWVMAIVTARRQLRAYMALQTAEVVEKGDALIATLHCVNAGQTPAYGFYAFSKTDVLSKDAELPPVDEPAPSDADRCVVGPGRVVKYTKYLTTSRVHLAAMKKEAMYGFIWGGLRYVDTFGINRFLTFAYRTGYDVRGNWLLQPKGNEEAN